MMVIWSSPELITTRIGSFHCITLIQPISYEQSTEVLLKTRFLPVHLVTLVQAETSQRRVGGVT